MKKIINKQAAILDAIERMKTGAFKATSGKIELEAQLNRGAEDDDDNCGYCDEGQTRCGDCNGSGTSVCERCDETGIIEVEVADPIGDMTTGNTEQMECPDCEGRGYVPCFNECDNGYFTCEECNGDYDSNDSEWSNEMDCQDAILKKCVAFGWAEVNTITEGHRDYNYGMYKPAGALKYAKFYNDHSVDSEFTFTFSLETPQDVLNLPKMIEVWNDFTDMVGNGVEVDGAGMHMALLSNTEHYYSPMDRPTQERMNQFRNFKKSMTLLLPALYFLGTGNKVSRGLEYRKPQVGCGDIEEERRYNPDKYSAINYGGGALEFRVFDTCYDNPEQILDNLVVMANCMRYWTDTYKPCGLQKITSDVRFGNDSNHTLERFYTTTTHLDLLNSGLAKLKPAYSTVGDVKKQRSFNINKNTIKNTTKVKTKEAVVAYSEYEERFAWSLKIKHHRRMYISLEDDSSVVLGKTNAEKDALIAKREAEVKESIERDIESKKELADYIAEKLRDYERSVQGAYSLRLES